MANNRLLAVLVLTMALIASACGAPSESELSQQQQIDELESRLEELSNASEADDAAVEAQIDDSAASEAESVDEPAEGPLRDSALNPAIGPNEFADLLESMVGPTDDLNQEMRQIDFSWPDISLLADTTIIGFDFRANFRNGSWRHETMVEFSTTAPAQQVALAYQTELAGLIPNVSEEVVFNSSEVEDGVVVYRASVGTFGERWFEISAQERVDGLAIVDLTSGQNVADREEVGGGVFAELAGVIAVSPIHDLDEVELSHVDFGHGLVFQEIAVGHRLTGLGGQDVHSVLDPAVAAVGWTLENEIGDTGYAYTAPEIAERAENEVRVSMFEPDVLTTQLRYRSPAELAAPGEPSGGAADTVRTDPPEAPVGDITIPLAVASGDVMNSGSGPNEVADLLDSLIGPTDDLSGELARIAVSWPPLSTLPDTEIDSVQSRITGQFLSWRQYTTVDFSTSSTPADAVLAIQTELAALLPGAPVSSSTEQLSGRLIFSASVGDFDVRASERDLTGTRVSITLNSDAGFDPDVIPPSVERLAGFSPLAAEGEFIEVNFVISPVTPPEITVVHHLEGFNESQAREVEDTVAAGPVWTFLSEGSDGRRYEVAGVEGRPLLTLDEFTAPGVPDVVVATVLFTG